VAVARSDIPPWGAGTEQRPAPTLRLRHGDLDLALPCSADTGTAACARIALDIVDELRRASPGYERADRVRRDRDRDRGGYDGGDRPYRGDGLRPAPPPSRDGRRDRDDDGDGGDNGDGRED
jgi:hypothetical protein